MQKDRPSVLYIFKGSRDSIPWSEIKRVLVAEFGRNSALTFTVTCSGIDKDSLPQAAASNELAGSHAAEANKRPTLVEVAREAGVSITTVSRVIHEPWTAREEVRQRVDAAIEQLGYTPNETARSLVRRKFHPERLNGDAEAPLPGGVRELD